MIVSRDRPDIELAAPSVSIGSERLMARFSSRRLHNVTVVAGLLVTLSAFNAQARELAVVSPGTSVSGPVDQNFSSLAAAMAALQPGDHLTIAPGAYREAMHFPERDWASAARTTVEGSGAVVINGADVATGWTALGDGKFSKPWKNEAAQVVMDGVPLQQIGGTVFDGFPINPNSAWHSVMGDAGGIWPGRRGGDEASLPLNSFYFDPAAGRLYLRVAAKTLDTHVVEVSTRAYAAFGEKLANVTIKGISFRLGNTSISSRAGLVTLKGNHLILDHVSVTEADSVGVELDGDDNIMEHVVADHCGQLGIKARGSRVWIHASQSNFNNTRGFNKWWEAGGAKFVGDGGLRNSTVSAHNAIGNYGDGIWFDWGNVHNRIDQCNCAYNTGFGIQYEASFDGTIVDNVVVGNEQRGIYLPHSSDSVVAYNLVAANRMQGIAIIDEGRTDPDGVLDLRPRNNRVFANMLAWNGAALTLPAVRGSNTSNGNVYIDRTSVTRLALGWKEQAFVTLPAWRAATGQDLDSLQIEQVPDVSFIQSVAAMRSPADLRWYRELRSRLRPMDDQADVALSQAMRPGNAGDTRPGPAL
jgi:parallel beta-helix repeat protein